MSNRKSPQKFDYAPYIPEGYSLEKVLQERKDPGAPHKTTLLLHDANACPFILKLSQSDCEEKQPSQQPLVPQVNPEALAFFKRANIQITTIDDTTSLIPSLGKDVTQSFFNSPNGKSWRTNLSTQKRLSLFDLILTSLHEHYYRHGIPHGNIRPENLMVRDDQSILLIDPDHRTTRHIEGIFTSEQQPESLQEQALHTLVHTGVVSRELIRKIKVFARDFQALQNLFSINDPKNIPLNKLCESYLNFEIDITEEKKTIVPEKSPNDWTVENWKKWYSYYYSEKTLNTFIDNVTHLHQAVRTNLNSHEANINTVFERLLNNTDISAFLNPSSYQTFPLDELIQIFNRIKDHKTILSQERGFFRLFGSTGHTKSYQQALRTIKQEIIKRLLLPPENTSQTSDLNTTAKELLQQHTSRVSCVLTWLGCQTDSYKEFQAQQEAQSIAPSTQPR